MKTFAKVIAYILVALLVAGAIGLVYRFTNGFNEDFKTFYVEYNGKQILTTDSKLVLRNNETHTFNVKYTFDSEKSEPKDYKVKIIPNVERDFDYTVNGEKYLFSKTGEFTSVFGLKKGQTKFSITIPAEFKLHKALMALNSGKTVIVPTEAAVNNPYPFRLIVSSYNDNVIFNIDLKIIDRISDVIVTPGEIVFGGDTPHISTGNTYDIEYFFSGDASNLLDVNLEGATQAKAGDKVTFKLTIGDENYSVSDMHISVMNSDVIVGITEYEGEYSFTMPKGNTYVWIYLYYNSPDDIVRYSIGYDSLGSASMDIVNLNCQDKAGANETVTFTAEVKPEYVTEYKISHITVELCSGDAYIEDLQGNNGTYTFTMPDTEIMETEGYITLLFYIIPVE